MPDRWKNTFTVRSMEVVRLVNLLRLEWGKLKRVSMISEVTVFLLVMMVMPSFLIQVANIDHWHSYADLINLFDLSTRMAFTLYGASLINQVVIEEYKSKTISVSFGYPISRRRLFMAKIVFIGMAVFAVSLLSFLLSGVTTYLLNGVYHFLEDSLTGADVATFLWRMLVSSAISALIGLVPLFYFGVIRRATIPAVLCALILMQAQNFSYMFDFNQGWIIGGLALLGLLNAVLTLRTIDRVGDY